jgi:diguanylate cyclase (GGDEF)-like protein
MLELFSDFWTRRGAYIAGIVLFLAVLAAGAQVVGLQSERLAAQYHADLLAHGSALQARVTRELSGVLFVSSGLSAYLTVRNKSQDRSEIDQILAQLYAQARHVRNFGIAVGTTLTYVYPLKGNERAIGLRYPDVPEQWPGVKAIIDSGRPFLAGPVKLVQGGLGLIYRVPISIDGRYWGLLSTVVDAESLFRTAFSDSDSRQFEFALRGKDAGGKSGATIWGDDAVFDKADVETMDIEVPGGKWTLGLGARDRRADSLLIRQMQVLTWILALLAGWYVFSLFRQRERLAHMALYDPLTSLPNRRLIEDRIQRAVLQQKRQSSTVVAILLFDLDGFKPVNDQHGHKTGDHVLQGVAARVGAALRTIDTVGRWGGDEFVVVLQQVERSKLDEVVERVRQAVAAPLVHGDETLTVGATIGVAISPDDGDAPGQLVRLADQRMYEKKVNRRGA